MTEKTERALRAAIERSIYDAGFSEARIRLLRDGLPRLGPGALREFLSIVRELGERAQGENSKQKQGRLW